MLKTTIFGNQFPNILARWVQKLFILKPYLKDYVLLDSDNCNRFKNNRFWETNSVMISDEQPKTDGTIWSTNSLPPNLIRTNRTTPEVEWFIDLSLQIQLAKNFGFYIPKLNQNQNQYPQQHQQQHQHQHKH